VVDVKYADRVMGSLLGGAIGDALGAPVEFLSRDEIVTMTGKAGVRDYLPAEFDGIRDRGLVTDDTQMVLFTMEGLIAAHVRRQKRGIGFVMALVQDSYLRWYQTQVSSGPASDVRGWLGQEQWLYSRRAPGATCLSALQFTAEQQDRRGARVLGDPAVNSSKGCGAVMRAAPFGWIPCFPIDRDAVIIPNAMEVAGYTHGHPTGQITAAALAVMIYEILQGRDARAATESAIEVISSLPNADESVAALQHACLLAEQSTPSAELVAELGQGWVAEEALAIAVYCALSFPKPNQVLDALSLAVTHSGDSDSTGAICGNIVGALHGATALPFSLLDELEGRAAIERIGTEFIEQFAGIDN
jgi:ADP-ribosylglycohydrolase